MISMLPQDLVLKGQFVCLQPLVPSLHSEQLYILSHADDRARQIFTYLQRGPYESLQDHTRYLEAWSSLPDVRPFVVKSQVGDETLGTLSLMSIRDEHRVAEIGNVWYGPSVQRTPINTECVYLLLKHCFETFRLRRIEWKCDTRNRPSGQAALRLGFRFEGVFRKHMIIRDQNRDSAWFSMVDDEWPARRVVFENCLYRAPSIRMSSVHPTTLPY